MGSNGTHKNKTYLSQEKNSKVRGAADFFKCTFQCEYALFSFDKYVLVL